MSSPPRPALSFDDALASQSETKSDSDSITSPLSPVPSVEWDAILASDAKDRTPLKAVRETEPKQAEHLMSIVQELKDRIFQVEIDHFLDKFLPGEDFTDVFKRGTLGRWKKKFSGLDLSVAETGLYPPLCAIFNSALDEVRSEHTQPQHPVEFYPTHKYRQDGMNDLTPDISLYPTGPKHYRVNDTAEDFRALWSWIEVPIEVKVAQTSQPFNFTPGDLILSTTDKGKHCLGQITQYACEIQLHQYRVFLFSVFIWRDRLRLMRWDRAGLVVSSPINYVEDPSALLLFIYRYAIASPEDRGHDPSVSLVNEAGAEFFRLKEFKSRNTWHPWYHREMLRNTAHYPIRKITAPLITEDGKVADTQGTYLVGRYFAGTHTPTGRGTKCCAAFDVQNDRLVFMKDYWCSDHHTVQPELSVYMSMHEKGVRNILTAIAGGDVGGKKGQCTANQEEMTTLPEDQRPTKRFHHRIFFLEIGRPLETHDNQPELLRVMRDAVLAHRDAYEKCGILHRDVCPKNILIDTVTGKGLLVDWELSRKSIWLSNPASQPSRSGSWQTMSARLLEDPNLRAKLSDDLESFFHSLCLMRLRFYRHDHSLLDIPAEDSGKENVNSQLFGAVLYLYNAKVVGAPGRSPGGKGKRSMFKTGEDLIDMAPCPLQTLSTQLLSLFHDFYAAIRNHQPFKKVDDHATFVEYFEKTIQPTDCNMRKTPDQLYRLTTQVSAPERIKRSTGGGTQKPYLPTRSPVDP